jgi:hypothetical protein
VRKNFRLDHISMEPPLFRHAVLSQAKSCEHSMWQRRGYVN